MKRILTLVILLLLSTFGAFASINISFTYKDASCGNNNGSLETNVFGGAFPYTYLWSTGETTPDISNLAPGIYTVTITDAIGDTASASAPIINTPDITGVGISYIMPGTSTILTHPCNQFCTGTGYLAVEYMNGTPPYSLYTSMSHPIGVFGLNNIPTVENICTNDNYMVYVTDALGCTGTGFGTLTYPANSFDFTSQVVPACNGINNGSIQLTFTNTQGIPYTANWTGPVPGQLPGFNPTVTLSSLLPGNYSITISNDYALSCDTTFMITVANMGTNCGTVSGITYADTLQDCIPDVAEPITPNRMIVFTPGPYYATSDSLGDYTATLPYGTYTAQTLTNNYFTSVCSVPGINLTAVNNNITGIDLGDSTQADLDLISGLSSGAARPGFNHHMYTSVHNLSFIEAPNVDFILNYDPTLTFVSSSVPYTVTGPAQITIHFDTLGEFQSAGSHLIFTIPPDPLLIGVYLNTYGTVVANQPELNTANNAASLQQEITGSFDPNEKAVWPAFAPLNVYLVDVDTLLSYTIRFQNTGNDTAFNVMLVDTLSEYLDIASFQMVGSSHPCTWQITGQNVLQVFYNNILLPDSNVNEPASHGLFSFSVTHTPALMNVLFPFLLENKAAIYFDFNPPIITNTAFNTIDISVGLGETHNNELNVYPNPADEFIVVTTNTSTVFRKITITDLLGRIIVDTIANAPEFKINIKNLTAGPYVIIAESPKGILRKKLIKY